MKKKKIDLGNLGSITESGEQGENKILKLADGRFVDVVGESHYQDALEEICGGRTKYDVYEGATATLIPEDDNPFDDNAVRVEIKGRTVGYLKKSESKRYREKLREAGFLEIPTTCKATIMGGGERRGDYMGYYGVTLGLPYWGRLKYMKTGVQTEMKKCPKCAGEVKSEALICRFCGHKFRESIGLSERIPCTDGSCVGIINEKGICNICGKPHSKHIGRR